MHSIHTMGSVCFDIRDLSRNHIPLNNAQDYVELVLAEIEAAPPQPGQKPLATVFFGGGTPSLIPPPLLARLLGALRAKFGIVDGAEISMEADPGAAARLPLQAHLDAALLRIILSSYNDAGLLGTTSGMEPVMEKVV